MIAISIKKDRVGFLSAFYSKNEIIINDFGILPLKSQNFNGEIISKILNRKKIKNSNIVSKKCVICIESDEVFLNQVFSTEQIDSKVLVQWTNNLMFGDANVGAYSDLHYNIFDKRGMLSIYLDKGLQLDYYGFCKDSGLSLSCLSVDIFSADYLAREMFEAKENGDYLIWAIGKQKDDMLIVKDNKLVSLISFKRLKSDVEVVKCIGSEKYAIDCLNKMSESSFMDLKSIDFVKKIFMYQKCHSSTDMKKVIKKNKDVVTVLNPLLKIDSFKKKRNEDINSSFLSEMGYLFKIIKDRGQIGD